MILKRAEICEVFHWDGLLLMVCLIKDERRLVVWNPYLRQNRWIKRMNKLNVGDMYGHGYENKNNNRNHKILRLLDVTMCSESGLFFEIYDFNSDSWRVLDVNHGCGYIKSGVSIKGNTYFLVKESVDHKNQFFLLCFDFTAESFGQRLVLPFGAYFVFSKTVVLSCVRDEQLAVLHQPKDSNIMDIWITTKIEPNAASWTRFVRRERGTLMFWAESFFIDEEKKLALVSGFCKIFRTNYKRAYIIEEHGNIKNVNLGKAREPGNKLLFSSYAPTELIIVGHKLLHHADCLFLSNLSPEIFERLLGAGI